MYIYYMCMYMYYVVVYMYVRTCAHGVLHNSNLPNGKYYACIV